MKHIKKKNNNNHNNNNTTQQQQQDPHTAMDKKKKQNGKSSNNNNNSNKDDMNFVPKSPHLVINGVDFDGNRPVLISKDPQKRHGMTIQYGSISDDNNNNDNDKKQKKEFRRMKQTSNKNKSTNNYEGHGTNDEGMSLFVPGNGSCGGSSGDSSSCTRVPVKTQQRLQVKGTMQS